MTQNKKKTKKEKTICDQKDLLGFSRGRGGSGLHWAFARLVAFTTALVAGSVARGRWALGSLVSWLAAVEAPSLTLATLAVLLLWWGSTLNSGVGAVGSDVSSLATVVARPGVRCCVLLHHRCSDNGGWCLL